ncbi:MAG: spore maturation protein [Clostridia bacterium]|nr:spore maturation protein [Clostridia bacterium]
MILCLFALFCLGCGLWKKVPLYDAFSAGAREGLQTAVQVLPALLCMLAALQALDESGLTAAVERLMGPVMEKMGVPSALLPLMLLRPLSGAGALAALEQVMENCGPDSRESLLAGVMVGSSETVFYTVAVYLAAARVKHTGYIIPCALLACLAGYVGALVFCP